MIESVAVVGNPEAARDIETALRAMRIVGDSETLISYRERIPFRRTGGESFGAAFSVTVMAEGREIRRTIFAKAIVAGIGIEGARLVVRTHVRRLALLDSWGIRVPHVYGHGDGTIYQAWIAGHPFRSGPAADVAELARIAAILDGRGASPLDFLSDLRIDLADRPHYVDAGSDLGPIADGLPPRTDRPARKTLLGAFPEARHAEIEDAYLKHVGGAQWNAR